jgi:hypothetical protein
MRINGEFFPISNDALQEKLRSIADDENHRLKILLAAVHGGKILLKSQPANESGNDGLSLPMFWIRDGELISKSLDISTIARDRAASIFINGHKRKGRLGRVTAPLGNYKTYSSNFPVIHAPVTIVPMLTVIPEGQPEPVPLGDDEEGINSGWYNFADAIADTLQGTVDNPEDHVLIDSYKVLDSPEMRAVMALSGIYAAHS